MTKRQPFTKEYKLEAVRLWKSSGRHARGGGKDGSEWITSVDSSSRAMDIGKELVALCGQGKNKEAIDRFYSPNIESVEPCSMPGMEQTQRGIAKIKGKNQRWVDNHQIHGGTVEGPYPHGDCFIVRFKYDVTPKHTGKRMTMDETGLYTAQNGKIVKEEFFYSM